MVHLGFLTPIIELEFREGYGGRARIYIRAWREGYERNWNNFFDPIAIRLHASSDKLGVDLTVMPLIGSSDYNALSSFTRGATLKKDSGDPHTESIFHAVLGINLKSSMVQAGASVARGSC